MKKNFIDLVDRKIKPKLIIEENMAREKAQQQ